MQRARGQMADGSSAHRVSGHPVQPVTPRRHTGRGRAVDNGGVGAPAAPTGIDGHTCACDGFRRVAQRVTHRVRAAQEACGPARPQRRAGRAAQGADSPVRRPVQPVSLPSSLAKPVRARRSAQRRAGYVDLGRLGESSEPRSRRPYRCTGSDRTRTESGAPLRARRRSSCSSPDLPPRWWVRVRTEALPRCGPWSDRGGEPGRYPRQGVRIRRRSARWPLPLVERPVELHLATPVNDPPHRGKLREQHRPWAHRSVVSVAVLAAPLLFFLAESPGHAQSTAVSQPAVQQSTSPDTWDVHSHAARHVGRDTRRNSGRFRELRG